MARLYWDLLKGRTLDNFKYIKVHDENLNLIFYKLLKFSFSKKATKFDLIFHSERQIQRESNFVAFLEKLTLIWTYYCV